MKKRNILGMITIIFTMLLTACGQGNGADSDTAVQEGERSVFNIVESGEISTLDASRASDGFSFGALNNVMEGLFMPGPDGEPVPGVAESYEVNEDNTVYTFTLREDARWSNGDPVTAHDFEFSWRRAVDPETASGYAFIMHNHVRNAERINNGELPIEDLGVRAIDDHTLEVTLEQPVPYFIGLLGIATFFPLNEEFVVAQGDDFGTDVDTTLYNGPFMMSEWRRGESYQMQRNPYYWDAENVQLDEINVSIISEVSTAVNLYETNRVDQVTLTSEFVNRFEGDEALEMTIRPTTSFLRLNQENEALSNENIRRAISLSINREGITETILNNGSIPADGLVPRGLTMGPDGVDFRDSSPLESRTDEEEARRLWEQGMEELGESSVSLRMIASEDSSSRSVAQYIQGTLESNLEGLSIDLVFLPPNITRETEAEGNFDISLASWGAAFPDPMTYLSQFTTDSPFNRMSFSNEAYDQLVEDANSVLLTDLSARWEALQEAERILVEEDAALIPIFQAGHVFLQRTNVQGVVIRPFTGIYSYRWASIN